MLFAGFWDLCAPHHTKIRWHAITGVVLTIYLFVHSLRRRKRWLTLELQNLGSVPIRLFPGLRVAQLMLWQTSNSTNNPYPAADFQARLGPEIPRTGWEEIEVGKLVAIGKRALVEHPVQLSFQRVFVDRSVGAEGR